MIGDASAAFGQQCKKRIRSSGWPAKSAMKLLSRPIRSSSSGDGWGRRRRRTCQVSSAFTRDDATLECGCSGSAVYAGLGAIQEYWAPKLRTATPLAFSLVKATRDDTRVVADYLSYEAKPVRMFLSFNSTGKIARSECAPRVCSKPAA